MNRSNSGRSGVGVTPEQKRTLQIEDLLRELERANELHEEQLRELSRLNENLEELEPCEVSR